MSARDHDGLVEPAPAAGEEAEIERLRRRLARERRARGEAEAISERTTRQLYDHQQRLLLLTTVANAANEASDVLPAIETCLDAVRTHGGWATGHAWLLDGADLVPTGVWVGDEARFEPMRRATEGQRFGPSVGLPGRVLTAGTAVWIHVFGADPTLPRADAATAIGLRSAVGFPILSDGEVAGVLEFFSEQIDDSDPELLELLEQVGTELGRVVERRRSADLLRHQATHDPLTGLPNRRLIREELERLTARMRREPDQRATVFFVDLDGFKGVNDTLGHLVGDRLLCEVTERLQGVLRPYDTLGRLSGDEFIVICDSTAGPQSITTVAERIARSLHRPFESEGELLQVTASIGVTEVAPDREPEELIAEADAAMYRAKSRGRSAYEVYSEEIGADLRRRADLERSLRHAADRGELELHYQPEIDLRTGEIVGMEALLRWRRETGMVMPLDFIPLAEETGLIVTVGAWVLDAALGQLKAWSETPEIAAPPWVSVNLSVRQLADVDLVERVRGGLDAHGADPRRLLLEVTESVVLEEGDGGLKVLAELTELGAEIAIDDFGTGYASLSYLARFPARTLKIDRSFVASLGDPRNRAVVAAMVELGRGLGMTTVAEGIETEEQLRTVIGLGSDLGQGYYFSRPLPAAEATRLLAAGQRFATAPRLHAPSVQAS